MSGARGSRIREEEEEEFGSVEGGVDQASTLQTLMAMIKELQVEIKANNKEIKELKERGNEPNNNRKKEEELSASRRMAKSQLRSLASGKGIEGVSSSQVSQGATSVGGHILTSGIGASGAKDF